MTYVLVDFHNMAHRAKHVVRGDIDTKIGMIFHIIFNSINKAVRDMGGTHVVVAAEGRSWRKDFYEPYKANRRDKAGTRTPEQVQEDEDFFEALNDFQDFIHNQTNITFLQAQGCEADDFIARWIQTHPDDDHVIISSDSDFYQLLAPNVKQYNGVANQLITVDGIFDDRGRPLKDKKTGEHKQIGDPQWLLFEKCIRGDSSDNIFSAYPGVRRRGTKNKVGMEEAFADRNGQGFNWNTFMLQRWTDHNDVEHVVRKDYERNVTLVDLSAQPDNIKTIMDEKIVEAVQAVPVKQVGIKFMRFCGKYDLVRIGEQADTHVQYLSAGYQ